MRTLSVKKEKKKEKKERMKKDFKNRPKEKKVMAKN